MPRYEISMITKLLDRDQKVEVLGSVVKYLLGQGHVVRKVEHLGDRCLPVKMDKQTEGSYFVLDTDFSREAVVDLKKFFTMQENVLRSTILPQALIYDSFECTEDLENYGDKLQELVKAKPKKEFSININADIVPFPL